MLLGESRDQKHLPQKGAHVVLASLDAPTPIPWLLGLSAFLGLQPGSLSLLLLVWPDCCYLQVLFLYLPLNHTLT